ncbi:unknown protein [Seminavis robusta]|uniref:Uncharacterized protein n=1 Tax=Seminavis robusta TaxID=568900 RepID=A0A9N8EWJ6_9STRA|nr:unknown protein [Seminavis robusta]|eukprot:Sro2144_g316280.1 n/a (324) ;mRNA; r:1458-2429
MFTIRPGAAIEVKTYPANLVTASVENEFLTFTYQDVGPNTQEGGVLITFPADLLWDVRAESEQVVQVLPGFNDIFAFFASTSSSLTVDGSTLLGEENLLVDVGQEANMQFHSGRPITELDVSTSAKFYYQGDLTGSGACSVSTSGNLEMKGNLVGPATCDISTSSHATIEGDLLVGTMTNVGTSGSLTVMGSILGTVDASIGATVTAASCANVALSFDGTCSDENVVDKTVTVNVDTQPLTLMGTETCCQVNEVCVTSSSTSSSSTTTTSSSSTTTITTSGGVTTTTSTSSGSTSGGILTFPRSYNLLLLPSVMVSMLMFGMW